MEGGGGVRMKRKGATQPLTSNTKEQMAVYSVTGFLARKEMTIRLGPNSALSFLAQFGSAST